MENLNENLIVLGAAYQAWSAGSALRQSRLRNKRFTYGDQWSDVTTDASGRQVTEWQRYSENGPAPITNNLIRQLVKTVVGRYRSQVIDKESSSDVARDNQLDELDSRALEEFLISGCCIQRVDEQAGVGERKPRVDNVNVNRFFINAIGDCRGWDCDIVGQLHELSVAQLMQRVAGGSARKAAWVRRLYSQQLDERIAAVATRLGADTMSGTNFWHATAPGKCRAIEVWALESREVMVCHNRRTAQLTVVPLAAARKLRQDADVKMRWDIVGTWHCRWFSPMGDLLCEYDSPWAHGRHPFAVKFYPLTDGEVHSMVEDIIDQQKFVNRLVTLVDHIMASSAKGVLLYPETALPDGFTWGDVRRIWSNSSGILPYSPALSDARPEQISHNGTNIGAYEMIQLQLKMLEEVSGVSGALQGRNVATGGSATLYETQSHNSELALADIFDTFTAFRRCRDRLLDNLHPQQ